MTQADIERVIVVEESSYPFPWTPGIFRDCLKSDYYCVILEARRALVGYAVMMMAGAEAHVLNICIDSDYRSQGLGRTLLVSLEEVARADGVEQLLLEVRVSNEVALAMYGAMGFVELGRRRGYYPAQGGREDAVVMGKTLKSPATL